MGGSGDGVGEHDGFGDTCRTEIGRILGLLDHPNFPTFWNELRTECLKIQQGIMTSPNGFKLAPFDSSLTQRIGWLKINVLNPLEKLIDALSASNQPYFRHWEEYGREAAPSRGPLLDNLSALQRETAAISGWLEGEVSGNTWDAKIRHTEEIRFYVVSICVEAVHAHFPSFPISRGNWDKELHRMTGIIPDYVRRIFLATTGQTEQLDSQIKEVIENLRKFQKKSR
jgi:hypothetical protein